MHVSKLINTAVTVIYMCPRMMSLLHAIYIQL